MTEEKIRVKRLCISPQALFHTMRGGKFTIESKIPQDAELVTWSYDYQRGSFILFIYHESFPEVESGGIPEALEDPVIQQSIT